MGKFLDAVFPLVPLYRANKVVRQKIHPKNENGKDIEPSGILSFIENADNLSSEIIKEQYNETFKVKEKLEDKAKTNIIGVTISITLIMGASGVLSTLNKKYPSPIFSWILFFLIMFSVAYMVTAGILVIRLLNNENEVYIVELSSLAADEMRLRDDYDKCISQNQNKNTIRNNYIFTSYECIRNSLICLFVILILIALPTNSLSKETEETLTYSSQLYSFMYSSSAVDYVKMNENEIRMAVEDAIIDTIEDIAPKDLSKTFGIVDDNSRLFIKFEVNNKSINVLLVEPYTPKI